MENTKLICDTCGQLIVDPTEGTMEWLVERNRVEQIISKEFGLRIVHKNFFSPIKDSGGCMYNNTKEYKEIGATIRDLGLDTLIGNDGLLKLLNLLETNILPHEDVIEMIKRIHILNYDKARFYIDEGISQGIIPPYGPADQIQIQNLLILGQHNNVK